MAEMRKAIGQKELDFWHEGGSSVIEDLKNSEVENTKYYRILGERLDE